MIMDPLPNVKQEKIRLTEINEYLTCKLCRGYFIDATTISECLHSFCRSCIIKFLQDNSHCPICEMIINKAKPNIKLDKTLQDIVYKLVPELFIGEMARRQAFYAERPAEARRTTPEERGVDTERTIFNPKDAISLSIEYISDDSIPGAIRVPEKQLQETFPQESQMKRFLQCPGNCRIEVLKKFVQNKYNVDIASFHIEILYKRVPLPNHYTLIDIAYIYSWKRNEPMKFFFRILDRNSVEKTERKVEDHVFVRPPKTRENSRRKTNQTSENSDKKDLQTSTKIDLDRSKNVEILETKASKIKDEDLKEKVKVIGFSDDLEIISKSDKLMENPKSEDVEELTITTTSRRKSGDKIELFVDESIKKSNLNHQDTEGDVGSEKTNNDRNRKRNLDFSKLGNFYVSKTNSINNNVNDKNWEEEKGDENSLKLVSKTLYNGSKMVENSDSKTAKEQNKFLNEFLKTVLRKDEEVEKKTEANDVEEESTNSKLSLDLSEDLRDENRLEIDESRVETDESKSEEKSENKESKIIKKPEEIVDKETVRIKKEMKNCQDVNGKFFKHTPTKTNENGDLEMVIKTEKIDHYDFEIEEAAMEKQLETYKSKKVVKTNETTPQTNDDKKSEFLKSIELTAAPKNNNVSNSNEDNSKIPSGQLFLKITQKRKNPSPAKTENTKRVKRKSSPPQKIIMNPKNSNANDDLKQIFSNCKFNIPSSLSITLKETNGEDDNKNLKLEPVKNYIEILKLPDQEKFKSKSAPSLMTEEASQKRVSNQIGNLNANPKKMRFDLEKFKNLNVLKFEQISAKLHSPSLGMNFTVSVNQDVKTHFGKLDPKFESFKSKKSPIKKIEEDKPEKSPSRDSKESQNHVHIGQHIIGIVKKSPPNSKNQQQSNLDVKSPKKSSHNQHHHHQQVVPILPKPSSLDLTTNQLMEKYNIQNLAQLTANLNFNPMLNVQASPMVLQQAILKQFELQNRQNWQLSQFQNNSKYLPNANRIISKEN